MSTLSKKNKFTNVSNILPKVVEKLGLDKRLNEQAFLSIWPNLIDHTLAQRSMPLYIDGNNQLLVAVQDSATAQELSFIKPKLIKKLQQTASQLGLQIVNIRFDIKQFTNTPYKHSAYASITDFENLDVTQSQLETIELSLSELAEIDNFKTEINSQFAEEQSEFSQIPDFSQRLINLIEKRIRLKKWHKKQNLPICKQCHEPLFQTGVVLCHYCLQDKQSQFPNDNKL